MKYTLLVILLTGCTTNIKQHAEAEWCFLCWSFKATQEIKENEKAICNCSNVDDDCRQCPGANVERVRE